MVINLGPVIYLMLAIQAVAGISCAVLLSLGIGWLVRALSRRRNRMEKKYPLGRYRLQPANQKAT